MENMINTIKNFCKYYLQNESMTARLAREFFAYANTKKLEIETEADRDAALRRYLNEIGY